MPTGDWPPGDGPKVFISYAHDTDDHRDQVLALGELLAHLNLRVALDHWAEGERRDWVAWATDLITTADYVLVVASPRYRARGGCPGARRWRPGTSTDRCSNYTCSARTWNRSRCADSERQFSGVVVSRDGGRCAWPTA